MITKKTKDNAGLYDTLFAEASEVLGAPVRTLDEYLLNIGRLREAELAEDYSLRFSRMPIDEPPFDINANSRQIEIPSDFKKNGIAVVGDHLAEILYFTVDRYYDTWDLLDPQIEVIAQWSYISGGKVQKSGISRISSAGSTKNKDAKVFANEGKIMFGWPINNIIAESAGTIRFSIRFFKIAHETDGDHLVFNMNTIPTAVEIKQGLDFVDKNGTLLEEIAYSNEAQLVSYRFNDGLGYKGGANSASKPEYIIDLSLYTPADLEEDPPVDAFIDSELFTEDDTIMDLIDGSLKFGISAFGTGAVSYSGYKDSSATSYPISYFYFKTEDTVANTRKTYYVEDEEAEDGYSIASFNDEDTMYERLAGIDANSVGRYWIVATNTMDPTISDEGWGRATLTSKTVTIPGPGDPTVTAEASAYIDAETGLVTIKATGTTTPAIEGVNDTINYTISDGVEFMDTANHVEAGAEETFEIDINELLEENDSIKLFNRDFTVTVASERNGSINETIDSTVITVTYPTQPVHAVINNGAQSAGGELEVTIDETDAYNDTILQGTLSYQWYKDSNNTLDNPNDDNLISGATSPRFTPSNAGVYTCKVTNTVNNQDASSFTSPILYTGN